MVFNTSCDRKPASDYTRSGGSRGCPSLANKIPLTLLAPKTYIGYTFSTHPSFVGYLSSCKLKAQHLILA